MITLDVVAAQNRRAGARNRGRRKQRRRSSAIIEAVYLLTSQLCQLSTLLF